jgi:DNA-binding XRE family transcriptional regulator
LEENNIKRSFLRQTRINRNLTQRYVEDSIGLKPKYIYKIENGDKNPSLNVAIRIAELYEIEVKQFKTLFQKDDE